MKEEKGKAIIQDDFIPAEIIEKKIFVLRGKKVMLDRDLADLYEVKTKVLNQAVRRNIERFPADFMIELDERESEILRSQFVTLRHGKFSKYASLAFTEQGMAMLSSVLRSKRAIMVNIQMRRFPWPLKERKVSSMEFQCR